jgi:nucleoside permease NupC
VLLTWFALVAPVIEVERTGIRAAFRRSRSLVRGHFWHVFWVVVPVVVISELISVFIQSGTLWWLGDGFFGEWAGGVLSNVLTAPLFALAVVVLFFELREARE